MREIISLTAGAHMDRTAYQGKQCRKVVLDGAQAEKYSPAVEGDNMPFC